MIRDERTRPRCTTTVRFLDNPIGSHRNPFEDDDDLFNRNPTPDLHTPPLGTGVDDGLKNPVPSQTPDQPEKPTCSCSTPTVAVAANDLGPYRVQLVYCEDCEGVLQQYREVVNGGESDE